MHENPEKMLEMIEAAKRKVEARRLRGPFPPTYNVEDVVFIGGFRGIIKKVQMTDYCPCYEAALFLPPDGKLANTLIEIEEQDPGVLDFANMTDLDWVFFRKDMMRHMYKHGKREEMHYIASLERDEIRDLFKQLSIIDPMEFMEKIDEIPHLRPVK